MPCTIAETEYIENALVTYMLEWDRSIPRAAIDQQVEYIWSYPLK